MNRYDSPLPPFPHTNNLLQKLESLTFVALQSAVLQSVRRQALQCKAASWLHDVQPPAWYCAGDVSNYKMCEQTKNTTHMMPFVEKIVVPAGSRVITIGDLHGDVATLVTLLYKLVQEGIMDNEYRIIAPNTYLFFVGDYTNRGLFSVEVWYLLMELQHSNIGHVFLLRGNHEYAASSMRLYQKYQGAAAVQAGRQSLLAELGTKFSVYYYPDLLYWFDYLPLAVFVGSTDAATGITNFMQICHGGIELGYNPAAFLQSDARFELLTSLPRSAAVQTIAKLPGCEQLPAHIERAAMHAAALEVPALLASYTSAEAVELTATHNPFVVKIGLQWHHFICEGNKTDLVIFAKDKALYWGRAVVAWYVAQADSATTRLVSIIRGHQHLNTVDETMQFINPMLNAIVAGRGCARQWQGRVYTLGDTGVRTEFQSLLMVTMAGAADAWLVQQWYKRMSDNDTAFEGRTFLMLS